MTNVESVDLPEIIAPETRVPTGIWEPETTTFTQVMPIHTKQQFHFVIADSSGHLS